MRWSREGPWVIKHRAAPRAAAAFTVTVPAPSPSRAPSPVPCSRATYIQITHSHHLFMSFTEVTEHRGTRTGTRRMVQYECIVATISFIPLIASQNSPQRSISLQVPPEWISVSVYAGLLRCTKHSRPTKLPSKGWN